MTIKFCGMRDADNIREAALAGADIAGLVFCTGDKRFVGMISSRVGVTPDYSPERVEELKSGAESTRHTANLPRAGVFADEMVQNIVTRTYNFKLDYIQLNGNESPTMMRNLRATLDPDIRPGIRIIKTLTISHNEDFSQCERYFGVADLFLFRGERANNGDKRRPIPLELLANYKGTTPFLLGGAVGEYSVEELLSVNHQAFAGVDLGEDFETEEGRFDFGKASDFVKALRHGTQTEKNHK